MEIGRNVITGFGLATTIGSATYGGIMYHKYDKHCPDPKNLTYSFFSDKNMTHINPKNPVLHCGDSKNLYVVGVSTVLAIIAALITLAHRVITSKCYGRTYCPYVSGYESI